MEASDKPKIGDRVVWKWTRLTKEGPSKGKVVDILSTGELVVTFEDGETETHDPYDLVKLA